MLLIMRGFVGKYLTSGGCAPYIEKERRPETQFLLSRTAWLALQRFRGQ